MTRSVVAHLAEPWDPDEGRLGKLEVLIAREDDGRAIERLPPTEPEAAIAWARERADDVRIHLWDCSTLWAAGSSNPLALPEWPGMESAVQAVEGGS